MFSAVLKYNHNHDKRGRFSTAVAVRDLNNGKKVDIPLNHLAPALHAMSRDDTLHPNLMNATVSGEPVFSRGNLGIPRSQMPQIPQRMRQKFIDGLNNKVKERELDPTTLKPTQGQLDGMKVGRLYRDLTTTNYEHVPIIVSNDGYVLDGHHHWGAKVAMRLHDGKSTISAYHVDMPQAELMRHAQRFTDENNIPRKDITKAARILKYNPYHDPHNGQFTTGPHTHNADAASAAADYVGRAGTTSTAGDAYEHRAAMVQNLFNQYGVDRIVPKTHQDDSTQAALYAKAQEAHSQLNDVLDNGKGIADQLGYQKMGVSPDKADMKTEGGMLFMAPLKPLSSATAKVNGEYGGDWSRLLDATRATIAVDKLSDVHKVIEKLHESGIVLAREPKNRLAKPLPSGYRDILLNVTLPNGHVGELQIHVKSMLSAKSGEGHALYEQQRAITRKYKPDTPVSHYSHEDQASYKDLEKRQQALYNTAWEATPV